jgi:hypothetical protein
MSDPSAVVIPARLDDRIAGICRSEAEHAFDAADDAADGPADDCPDGSGLLVPHISAMGDAVRNALGLRRERHGERCDDGGCEHDVKFHAVTSFVLRGRQVPGNDGDCAALAWRRRLSAERDKMITPGRNAAG